MLKELQLKQFFLILFSIISIPNLFCANPGLEPKTLILRLKDEQKTFEKLGETELFPSVISNIISSYTAPKSILFNFLTPNLKGKITASYQTYIKNDKTVDKLLKQYPVLIKSIDKEDIKIDEFMYSYGSEDTMGKILIWTDKNYPISSKILVPLNYKRENILIKFVGFQIELENINGKNYRFNSDFLRDDDAVAKIVSFEKNNEFDVKLIEDLKNECQDGIMLKSVRNSLEETMKARKLNDFIYLCFIKK